jgi:hypothetical protein
VGYLAFDDTADPAPGAGRPSAWLKALRSAPALLSAVLLTRLWAALLTPTTLAENVTRGAAQRLAALPGSFAAFRIPADLPLLLDWPTLLAAVLLRLLGDAPPTLLLLSGRLLAVAALTAAVLTALRGRGAWFAVLLLLHSLAILPTVLLPQLALPLLTLVLIAVRIPYGPRDRVLQVAVLLLAAAQPWWLLPLLPLTLLLLPRRSPAVRAAALVGGWLLLLTALLLLRSALQLPWLPDEAGLLLNWLFAAAALDYQSAAFILPTPDLLIMLTALISALFLRRDATLQPYLLWLCGGLPLLLLIPLPPSAADLPAAALIAPALLPPLLLIAAAGLQTLWQRFQAWDDYWSWLTVMLPRPPWYAWLALTALVGFIAVIYGSTAIEQALGRVGWLQLPAGSVLPAAPYRSFALAADRLLLAADAGLYRAAAAAPAAGSTAAQPAVMLVAAAADADWWISGEQLVRQSRGAAPQQQPLPAAIGRVHAVAAAADGTLLLAAAGGAWQADAALTISRLPQLPPTALTTVAVGPDGSRWFAAAGSVLRLLPDGSLQTIALNGRTAAVSALLPLADGTLWIGTYGGGLGRWDGSTLQWQLSAANTSLRQITALASTADGALWVAAANSTAPGGALLRIDSSSARRLTARNSGFPDAETLSLIVDTAGRLWIATRMDGLLIFGG